MGNRWARRIFVVGIGLMALAGLLAVCCERQIGSSKKSGASGAHTAEDEVLIAAARQYLAQHRPEWNDVDDLEPRIVEYESYWKVTWDLPTGTIGGMPVVIIGKPGREVINAYHEQ